MGCTASNTTSDPKKEVNILLKSCHGAKGMDQAKLDAAAKKLVQDYLKAYDKDKDGKLSRDEAKSLLAHTWDVSQRSLLMHGLIKDEIKEAKYVSLLEVYEALFKRYTTEEAGTHAAVEGMEKEFKDFLLKANQSQQKPGGWNE